MASLRRQQERRTTTVPDSVSRPSAYPSARLPRYPLIVECFENRQCRAGTRRVLQTEHEREPADTSDTSRKSTLQDKRAGNVIWLLHRLAYPAGGKRNLWFCRAPRVGRRRSASCRSQNLVAQCRVEGLQEERREQYRETDHQPHDAVTFGRLEQRLRNADRSSNCHRTEDKADAAREIEQARGRAFATARRESERERLWQRQDDRACKCD